METNRELSRRLLTARMKLISENVFYGVLLMHLRLALDKNCKVCATDGNFLYFNPEFLQNCTDGELEYVLMHEVLHIALKHALRDTKRDGAFALACDIVVNSNIIGKSGFEERAYLKDYGGVQPHLAPNGKEGYLYSVEEVYNLIKGGKGGKSKNADGDGISSSGKDGQKGSGLWDDHSRWNDDDELLNAEWSERVFSAAKLAQDLEKISSTYGNVPLGIERLIGEIKNPKLDWRSILNDFVQEEVADYSFTPPDRRYDTPFFLPDFNDRDATVKNILFMIDTSASMTKKEVTEAYSEVYGAIDAFSGKLQGWLGFFDADVIPPKPFESEHDVDNIKPRGGGGTSFACIFKYIKEHMKDGQPQSIIILTDGYAPFPPKAAAMGIPVLWLLTNEIVKPPWGIYVCIK